MKITTDMLQDIVLDQSVFTLASYGELAELGKTINLLQQVGFSVALAYDDDDADVLSRRIGADFNYRITTKGDMSDGTVITHTSQDGFNITYSGKTHNLCYTHRDLTRTINHWVDLITTPSYIVEVLGLPWTLSDEIRLALSRGILTPDDNIEENLLHYSNHCLKLNITPSYWAASIGVQSIDETERNLVVRRYCALLMTEQPICPISRNNPDEWRSTPNHLGFFTAYRTANCYLDMSDSDKRLVQVTPVMEPDEYWTRWQHFGLNDYDYLTGDYYQSSLITPVTYSLQGVHSNDRTVIKLYAENKRSELVECLLHGERSCLDILGLTDIGKALIGFLQQHLTSEYILAVCCWATLYNDEYDDANIDASRADVLAAKYKVRYPECWELIRDVVETFLPTARPQHAQRKVHWVSVSHDAYLVNTLEGHLDAINDWTHRYHQHPVEVAAHEQSYPAIVTFFGTEPNVTVNYTTLPMGELTRAITIVGVN